LDASIVSLSTMGYFSNRVYWEQWFPAEFVVEALPGQFRNWFYALLAVSTMMVGRSPFKVLKGHGLVVDDEGKPMHKSAGNAIDFDDAAERIGVDVMRWLYAMTAPERNVLFGPKHCDEVRREVILPWWNMYSFFANLARVDDFDPRKHTVLPEDRSLLDRWILSDLHRLIRVAHESYGSFDVARFCAEAQRFIEVLSTWYVRRSRRRFYDEGWPPDKRAAYATLYQVLVTFNRLIAPIVPFMSEAIYQNLVVGPAAEHGDTAASVHHVPFPEADESLIDESLSAHVAASLRVVSLARAARKESRLKIRQPLAVLAVVPGDDTERRALEMFKEHFLEELNVKAVTIRGSAEDVITVNLEPNMKTLGPKFGRNAAAAREAILRLDGRAVEASLASGGNVAITLDGNEIPIDREDFAITRSYRDHWAGAAEGKTVVLLDKRVTPELKNEGLARDIVRNVQNLRKEAGLEIDDRIRLSLVTSSPALHEAISAFGAYIQKETLAVQIVTTELEDKTAATTIKIDGQSLTITLARAQ
jgi:isoleucyl-tRNA synthetase